MAQNPLDLEKRYDVIVTSSDLTSSLVAAAVSRAGKKVLHLDPYDRYGQEWAALKLFDVIAAPALLIKEHPFPENVPSDCVATTPPSLIRNVHLEAPVFEDEITGKAFLKEFGRTPPDDVVDRFFKEFYPKLKQAKSSTDVKEVLTMLKEELSSLNVFDNSFSIDLTPRFIFSIGEMVDILIRSNVTRYLEFRKIARILTPLAKRDGDKNENFAPGATFKLINVPCTRNDVFKSTTISMIEKRLLMRFLDFIKNASSTKASEKTAHEPTQPFSECLAEQKLTPKLCDLLVHSVLMVERSELINTGDALEKIGRFMSAIGRFADRPYLIPTYGTDDLVQAFCRYSAIYGATYCLNSVVQSLKIDDHAEGGKKLVTSVNLMMERDGATSVECDHVVTNYQFPVASLQTPPEMSQSLSRAIVCSRQSICADGLADYDNTSVLYLPPEMVGSRTAVYVFETDKSTNACPKGLYIQFFWCDATLTAVEDLKPVIEKLYSARVEASSEDSQPTLWSLYFNQSTKKSYSDSQSLAENLHHVSPPVNELDFEAVVAEAKSIFEKMYPEEEWFPETKEPSTEPPQEEEEEEEKEEKVDDQEEKKTSVEVVEEVTKE